MREALFNHGYKIVMNAVCRGVYQLTDVDRAFLAFALEEQGKALEDNELELSDSSRQVP